jgi:SAM-dependent methyltransferase
MSDLPTPPTFHQRQPGGVHSEAPWAQYRHVAGRLRATIAELGAFDQLPPGSRVLDYGCASGPYRDLLPSTLEYVGADIVGNPDADVVLNADGTVPLPDASFDLVLSSQVLEHVGDPVLYLSECTRLLRPGGALVLTTHGLMYSHRDPEDFWRWTSDGLAKVVEEAGLEVTEQRGLMGLASAAIQLFQDATLPKVPQVARKPYIMVLQAAAAAVDRRYSEASRLQDSLVLAITAHRPV